MTRMTALTAAVVPCVVMIAGLANGQTLDLMDNTRTKSTTVIQRLMPIVSDTTASGDSNQTEEAVDDGGLTSLRVIGDFAYRKGEDTLAPAVHFFGATNGCWRQDPDLPWRLSLDVTFQSPLRAATPEELADQYRLSGGQASGSLQGFTGYKTSGVFRLRLSGAATISWLQSPEVTNSTSTSTNAVISPGGGAAEDFNEAIVGIEGGLGVLVAGFVYIGWHGLYNTSITDSGSHTADLLDQDFSQQLRMIAKLDTWYLQATILSKGDSDREFQIGLAKKFKGF